MKKLKLIAGLIPAMVFGAVPSAQAGGLCDYWPFSLTRLCQAHNGGGTVSVAEPTAIVLLALGLIALGTVMYVRRRRANTSAR